MIGSLSESAGEDGHHKMDRRSRGTLGCSMMLFTPILLTGTFILANTSRDMKTNVDVFTGALDHVPCRQS